MIAPDTHFAKNSDGLALAYQTIGDGPVDVVFLPLFGSIDVLWEDPEYEHFLRRLAGIGRLILFDVRGNGASDPVPLGGLPTPDRWVDDLRVVLDAVGSTNTIIVATSVFGIMGMVFAAMYPERTKALVLIDSAARWLHDDDYVGAGTQEGIDGLSRMFRELWGTGVTTLPNTPSRAGDPAFRRWIARAERLTASPAELGAYWAWSLSLDVRHVLPVIQTPTLVVHNNPNSIVPVELSRYLASHIDGAQLVELQRHDSFMFWRAEGDRLLDAIEQFITGAPPVRRPDRALATVMFTDIVNSTAHAVRIGDKAWSDLLERHDVLLGEHLERYQGHKVAPTGDGLLATFEGPERAIRCAQEICLSVRSLGIEVRAGLHSGEVQRRRDNIDGIAVHIGSRVSSLAGPGEVLVSAAVKELVTGSDIRFTDRGAHSLKGVPEQWQLYAVV